MPAVRQIELTHSSGRLKLSVPILPLVPREMPPERMRWLRRLLVESQSRWRMVRTGFVANGEGQAAMAEVDVTGAPSVVLSSLVETGLEALRCATQWSVQSADLLADLSVPCRALEVREP